MNKELKFDLEMYEAISNGEKTQTRRCLDPQPNSDKEGLLGFAGENDFSHHMGDQMGHFFAAHIFGSCATKMLSCPYAKEGDIIKIWHPNSKLTEEQKLNPLTQKDNIAITIEKIWVEQLQDIDEDEAEQEGVDDMFVEQLDHENILTSHLEGFIDYWNKLHGESKVNYSWEDNPWVWVIQFHKTF